MVKKKQSEDNKPKISKNRSLPKVSIIIPVYNAGRYLEQCLNSVLSQTLKDIEIICIDDCSDDNSAKILKKFEKSGIKIITSDRQQGQAHARNVGIDIAKGKYIGFVDADDYADITMFEKMYKKAKKDNADIEICEAVMYDDTEKKTVSDDYFTLKCFPETFDNIVFNAEDTVDFIENINVTLWNKIYKTSFLKNNKIKFSEGYIYEDMPFIYEVYTKADKIGILRESLYYYRVNTKNSTMNKNDKKVLDRIDMVEKSLEIFKKLPYFEKIRGKILNWAIHDIYYRYTLIDSKYQKEFFFMMQKLFKNIDVSGVEDNLLLDPYYPYFCEIPKRNYDESVKYFANKDTFYDPYLDSIKNMKAEYEYQLEQKAEEIYLAVKEEYDKILDNTPLNNYNEISDTEKAEICDNYEKVIAELKEDYLKQQTKFDSEKAELCKSYDELQTKTDNEKAEICQNYEKVIAELKEDYLKQQTKFDSEKEELCKSYDELQTKTDNEKKEICDNYEKVISELKNNYSVLNEKFETEKTEICNNYETIISEIKAYTDSVQNKFDEEKSELCKNFDELQNKSDKEKKYICENYENMISELNENYLKQQNEFEEEKNELCSSYESEINKLKSDNLIKQNKFETLRNNYETEINELKSKYDKLQSKFDKEKQKICDNYDKILKEMKEEMDLQRKNCIDMLKEQLSIGQTNLDRIKSFRTKNRNEGK